MLNQPCIPGINVSKSWCQFFLVLLDLVCSYFIEEFCIYIHKQYWPAVFLLTMPVFGGHVFILGVSEPLGQHRGEVKACQLEIKLFF